MANDRSPSGDLRGFLVPDARFTFANVTAKGAGATDSTYTEGGSFTGIAEPDQATALRLATSGDQGADGDLELLTQRAGGIGPERAGYVWRDVEAGDTTSEYLGWEPPNIVTGWETLLWTTLSIGSNYRPHVVRTLSRRLLAVYGGSTLGVVLIKRYSPVTETWSDVSCVPTGASASYIPAAACLCPLPSGRVLCFVASQSQQQIDVYYTDDDGDTWAEYAVRALDVAVVASVVELRACYSAGEVLLFAAYMSGGSRTAAVYASASLATSFEQVTTNWRTESGTTEEPMSVDVTAGAAGGFTISYVDTQPSPSVPRCRRIGSAFDSFVTGGEIQVFSTGDDHLTVWRDDDGVMYAIGISEAASGQVGMVARSLDDAQTWETFGQTDEILSLYDSPTFTNRFESWSAMSLGGRTALVSRWTASGSSYDPQSVAVIWLGGYSTQTVAAHKNSTDFEDGDSLTWGDAADVLGGIWLPATVPGSVAWTASGAGSEAMASDGRMEITTAGLQSRYYERTADGAGSEAAMFEIALLVPSGGSTSAEEIGARIRYSDSDGTGGSGTFEYEITLRCSSTGFRVYDEVAGANLAAAETFDLTSYGRIRIAIDAAGEIKLWFGRAGALRRWTEATGGTLTSAGAGLGNLNRLRFGHTAVAANVSRVEMFGYCLWAGKWSPRQADTLASSWANPDDLHARSYPLSASLLTDDVLVRAEDGPTRLGETQRITANYTYPLRVAMPEIDESPAVTWATTADEQDVLIVWDLTGDSSGGRMLNHSIGCAILNANIGSCALEYYTGAAWQTILSMDSTTGWASLPYLRDGDVVYPNTGSASSSRWLSYGMAVGSWFKLDGNTYRRIAEHSEGAWEDAATKRPWLRLDGIDGSEPTSGTGAIRMKDFAAVKHEWNTDARYMRLKIAPQVAGGGRYAIGQIVIGHLVVLGYQYSRGFSISQRAQADVTTWRDGKTRARQLGRSARVIDIAWTDGTDASELAGSAAAPDYVAGSASGLPVAARADGPRLLSGLLASRGGPAGPVVLLPAIPRGTGTQHISSPTGIVWGRLGDEMSIDHVLGDELSSEVERTSRVTLREIV